MTKEKILITGGAGYIGSILVEDLLSNNFEVTVYDNFLYSQNSLGHLCHNTALSIEKGDVRDFKKLNNLIKQNDIIIPLAALVGAPICNFDPVGSKSINHDSVLKLFESISNDQKIIMPTTNSAYGAGDENNYCDESSHVMAALLKKFILAKRNKFKNVKCWGTGKPLREFLHVDDLGDACVHVMEKWNPDYEDSPKCINGEKLLYLNVHRILLYYMNYLLNNHQSKLIQSFDKFVGEHFQ